MNPEDMTDKRMQERKLRDAMKKHGAGNVNSISSLDLSEKEIKFLEEFPKNNFHIEKTLTQIGEGFTGYYYWKNKNPDFVKALEVMRDARVDLIEDAFQDLIKERNPQAVMFGLKTLGRHRGYVDRQEVHHKGISNVNIRFDGEIIEPVGDEEEDE